MMNKIFNLVTKFAAVAFLLIAVAAHAEDTSPAGSWTWSVPGRNNGPGRTNTLTLKIEDSKLTGTLSAPGRGGQVSEIAITDGTVTREAIAFSVIREVNGNSITTRYSGQVSGSQLTGKIQFKDRDGESQSHDWKATRVTETK